jgi:hypothetical protein
MQVLFFEEKETGDGGGRTDYGRQTTDDRLRTTDDLLRTKDAINQSTIQLFKQTFNLNEIKNQQSLNQKSFKRFLSPSHLRLLHHYKCLLRHILNCFVSIHLKE